MMELPTTECVFAFYQLVFPTFKLKFAMGVNTLKYRKVNVLKFKKHVIIAMIMIFKLSIQTHQKA